MSLSNFDRVKEFHTTFGVDQFSGTYAEMLDFLARRHTLLQEEFLEGQAALLGALHSADNMTHDKYVELIRGYLDSLADVLYVAYGTLELMGVNADALFEEVHSSNMSKLDVDGKPIKNPETGKVVKGPNYSPPNLGRFVDIAMLNTINKVQ
jgi:predicted HAD superfamily Cof-like phosphohydrolase